MSKIRDAAKGQDCFVRIPGICSHNPEQTVLAHIRMPGLTGMALKSIDLLGAFACDPCHSAVDGRLKTGFSHQELWTMHLEGMARTIDWLVKHGKVSK